MEDKELEYAVLRVCEKVLEVDGEFVKYSNCFTKHHHLGSCQKA